MTAWTGALLAAQKEASEAGAWSTIWPLLLTVAGTLAATSFVQLVVVPRVETRKRREDRWERDVIALGETLTFEHADAVTDFGQLLWLKAALDGPDSEVPPGELAELRREYHDKRHETYERYSRSYSHVAWLALRVEALDRDAEGLAGFRSIWQALKNAHTATLWVWMQAEAGAASLDTVDDVRDRERQVSRSLTRQIEWLSTNRPPRTSLRRRVVLRLRRLAAPASRWRARRQARSRFEHREHERSEQSAAMGG
jgi:hypothetical protein